MHEKVLKEIAAEIVNSKKSHANNYGLLSGLPGSTIFLYEYIRLDKSFEKYIEPFIDETFAAIENNAPYAAYCAGLSGACIGINFVYCHRCIFRFGYNQNSRFENPVLRPAYHP
jgi:hypothetical protein